jgi:SAM-dependent methyltransferase
MTYIFQPDRFILQEQVKKFSHYIQGECLDVGAGHYNRYGKFFSASKIIRMDIAHADTVDIVGSVDKIPLKDASVDSVICTQVFEHIKYPDAGAREIARVLKVGGYALITVPQMNELHEEPHDYFRYTSFGLKRIFEDAGLKIVEIDQRGGFFALMQQMLVRYIIDSLKLHQRPMVARLFGKLALITGKIALKLDSINTSVANRKHAIGWACVVQKK